MVAKMLSWPDLVMQYGIDDRSDATVEFFEVEICLEKG